MTPTVTQNVTTPQIANFSATPLGLNKRSRKGSRSVTFRITMRHAHRHASPYRGGGENFATSEEP